MDHLQMKEAARDRRRGDNLAPDADFRSDLERRLALALGIGRRTVAFLGTDGYRDSTVPDGNFAAEKPLAETAMLLHVASPHRERDLINTVFGGLLADLIPHARSQQMRCDVVRYPSVCLQLATPHIILNRWVADKSFEALLEGSWSASARVGHEVVPYRELEIGWLLSLWRGDPPADFAQIARKTALGTAIDLLNGTREDAYAHTHAPMYFTDFGNWQHPLPRSRDDILSESAAVLARALIAEDYDLAAEALMAWPLLNAPWSAEAAFGFRVVSSLEDRVGFLPAGRSAASQLLQLNGIEKTKCALATSYHTAYVMGMLCATALRPGQSSPFAITGPRHSPKLAADLFAGVPKTGAHWEEVYASLQPQEQAALVPFLRDVALIRASRRSDAALLADLLGMAVAHDLADTTLCVQAAELLSRLAALAQECPQAQRAEAERFPARRSSTA